MISVKGWLVFSEATAPSTMYVAWKKPSREFLKVWKTKAIPVTVRSIRPRKKVKP